MSGPLLVSCGEASGDAIVACVAHELGGAGALYGMAGQASRSAGVEVVEDADALGLMGVVDVIARMPRVIGAYRRLQREAVRRGARAALLVGFTEFNQRLGAWLRARSVRVVWCGAPQVWAWRRSRLRSLRRSVDVLAVMLPFEEPLWRQAGYQVRFVGHPCIESTRLRTSRGQRRLAVLCGSRAKEVARTGRVLLEAARLWMIDHPGWQAVAIAAPSLSQASMAALQRAADRSGVQVVRAPGQGAGPMLDGYELAMCVSGTASLEAAVSGAVPVVAYRFDPVTSWVARALVRTPHVGLANLVLGERAFPELVLREATAERVAAETGRMLEELDRGERACGRVRELLTIRDGKRFGARVAELL